MENRDTAMSSVRLAKSHTTRYPSKIFILTLFTDFRVWISRSCFSIIALFPLLLSLARSLFAPRLKLLADILAPGFIGAGNQTLVAQEDFGSAPKFANSAAQCRPARRTIRSSHKRNALLCKLRRPPDF